MRRSLSANPTTPLPSEFTSFEPGIVTRDEFLAFLNPGDKFHESDSYPSTVASLNESMTVQVGATERSRRGDRLIVSRPHGDESTLIFQDADSDAVAGVFHDGVLFKDRFREIPDWYVDVRTREPVMFRPAKVKEVKYPGEQVLAHILDPVAENAKRFPVLLQRFNLGANRAAKKFELRSEVEPRKDRLDTLAILYEGWVVAMGSNEWGATLLRVAEEYRGIGLGVFLKDRWTEFNPSAKSGGFTRAGQATALASWKRRVHEFLALGWYSELLRQGRMTKDRVKEITAGAAGTKADELRLPSDAPVEIEKEPSLLVYLGDGSFVLYDERFLSDPDEKYVHGHGFLRETTGHGPFFFRLDYDLAHADLTTAIALQMARDLGDEVYVDASPGDLVEWERVPHARYADGRVTLTQDILSLPTLAREERAKRKNLDQYDEKFHTLVELADSKWR